MSIDRSGPPLPPPLRQEKNGHLFDVLAPIGLVLAIVVPLLVTLGWR